MGALAVVALLGLTLAVTAAGWATFNELGGDWVEEFHEVAAHLMLAVVGVHVAGVVLGSRLHHESLVAAMITGRKRGNPQDGVRRAWHGLAALMLVAVLDFWWLQWQSAPPAQWRPCGRPAWCLTARDAVPDGVPLFLERFRTNGWA